MAIHEAECVQRKVEATGAKVVVRNVLESLPEPGWLEGVDGVFFGGSGDFSVYDERSQGWVRSLRHLLDRILDAQLPGFGICFGHQLLGFHFGGNVVTDPEHVELGTVTIGTLEAGQSDSLLSKMPTSYFAQTGHSDYVDHTPEGLTLLGSTEILDTQIFRVEGAPFYSTQFHPDMTGEEGRARYLAYSASLSKTVSHDVEAAAESFEPGKDEATALLPLFVREFIL
jgi:GMP synthase (glutamine-hydrolysing)